MNSPSPDDAVLAARIVAGLHGPIREITERLRVVAAGERARHLKFHTAADVERPGVRELLAEAARLTPRP